MKKRKLFRLLASLRPEEFQQLRKAVHSPYFNTNPTVVQLFEAIRTRYPGFDFSPNALEKIYGQLFPGQPYNDPKLRRLFTFLKRIVEEVMAHQELRRNDFLHQKMLLQSLAHRELSEFFEKGTADLLHQLEESRWQNRTYFFEKMQLLHDRYFHPLHKRYDPNDQTLEQLMDSVDAFFAFCKIQYGMELKNRAHIFKSTYKLRLLGPTETAAKNLLDDNVLFTLYQTSFSLSNGKKEADLEAYEQALFQHLDDLDNYDQRALFYNGLNFAIRRFNAGEISLSPTILRWYKLGLEKRLLITDGRMTSATFGNIVHHGCLENDFDWTNRFVAEYRAFLQPDINDDEVACALALIHFYQKNYPEVIFQINQCSYAPQYQLRSKNILLRAYFEMYLESRSDSGLLNSAIISFEQLLYRNEYYPAKKIKIHLDFVQRF